ncbi:MAG: hypothetical protein HFE68_03960 [Erysipelotrichaceae bacterium]|nr:hypothetical protein [Erysipelotrichaceae bacterium]
MKSLIQFAALFFMFTCTLMMTTDMMNTTARKEELEDALSLSMRNTLKASQIACMYDMEEQDMRSELIRNLADNINGDGTFTVVIHEASEQGLLDVSVREQFLHNNAQSTSGQLRRTLLAERYVDDNENEDEAW